MTFFYSLHFDQKNIVERSFLISAPTLNKEFLPMAY